MEQTPPTKAVTKKTKKSHTALKIITWVGLGLFIITIATGGYLYATNKLTFAFGSASTVSSVAVCGDAIITNYNAAMFYRVRSPEAKPTLDEAGLNNLEKEIPTKAGYAQDPTCQTILFWIAINHRDANKAQLALTALESLHSEGKYVNSNLNNSVPLSKYKISIDYLSASVQR